MIETPDEHAINERAYRQLKGSLQQTYGRGRFVAICNGRVSADAATFADLRSLLLAMGKDPVSAFIVQAGADFPEEAVIFRSCGRS